MDWMLMPYRRYADFSGRSRRMEFWMFQLFVLGVYFVGFVLMMMGMPESAYDPYAGSQPEPGAMFWLGLAFITIFGLASFIPSLAVAVRRLHDQGKSGWFLLISFIPFGGLVLLVFYFIEGDRGENQYGPDPKDPANAQSFT